jgi:hypothetical protein
MSQSGRENTLLLKWWHFCYIWRLLGQDLAERATWEAWAPIER